MLIQQKQQSIRAVLNSMLLICSLIFLSACSTPSDKILKSQAENLADQLYQLIAAKDFQKASALYATEFYDKITPEQWILVLQSEQEKFGAYKNRKLTGSNVSHGFSTRSTTVVVLVYRVYFENHSTIEKLTYLYSPDTQRFQLVGHFIDFTEDKK